jgi:serine/threonine protein kinase
MIPLLVSLVLLPLPTRTVRRSAQRLVQICMVAWQNSMARPTGQASTTMGAQLKMTTVPPTSIYGGRYRLTERIASGGMGDVWRATDELLRRSVAIKLLRREFGSVESFRQRFRFEAQAAAGLSHSGIAAVYDYGEETDSDGGHLAYIVMELVEGESLDVRLRRVNRLDAPETLDIVGQAARSVQAAHDRGIVHRDIKPANLLIREDGVVKVTDFGIARALDGSSFTQTGAMLGTVQYMSPEQLSGQTATPASDIYALGVLAYCCLAGQTPFVRDESVAVALAHVRDDVPPLPEDIPTDVSGLVFQMLAKDPSKRPASAGSVAANMFGLRNSLTLVASSSLSKSHLEDSVPVFDAADNHVSSRSAATGSDDATKSISLTGTPPTLIDRSMTAIYPKPAVPAGDRPHVRSRRWAVLGGLFVVAGGLAVLLPWLLSGPGNVTVPSVIGMSVSTARAKLQTQGLPTAPHLVDGHQSAGLVESQKPRAGAHVAKGSAVRLAVASGYVDLNSSQLVGRSSAEVAAAVSGLGLQVTEQSVTSTAASGSVVAVTPGGRLKLGTAVTVGVATAPIQTTPTSPPPEGKPGKKGHQD